MFHFLLQDMRCMLLWATLVLDLNCYASTEQSYVYNFHHTSSVLYFCDAKDHDHTDFHCYGGNLTEIPNNLSNDLRKLSVTDANLKHFKKSFLDPYRNTLKDM